MKSKIEATYEQMGIAALLPGMVHAVELMENQINQMRARLAALQEDAAPARRVGRPRGTATNGTVRSGWPADPEERKLEMARRRAKRAANLKLHPRDPRHPQHAEWVAKVSKAAKKRWNSMSPDQREARLKSMAAGQSRNKAAA